MQPQTEYPESPQVAASSTLALVHYLETRGLLDRVRVEQATGLTLATLKDPDLRVPASAHYRLWELAEQLTADPGVGLHAGQVIDPSAWGWSAMCSSTATLWAKPWCSMSGCTD